MTERALDPLGGVAVDSGSLDSGASTGRDGDLPKWMAKGAESGGIPRRSLVVVGVLAAVYLVALVFTGLDLAPFTLVVTVTKMRKIRRRAS
jgi:amino acid transporter